MMARQRNRAPYELHHHCGGCGKKLTASRPASYQAMLKHWEDGRILSLGKCWLCSRCAWNFHGFGLLFATPKKKDGR